MKIEKSTLESIGHVLKMKNARVVKQITLEWLAILKDERKNCQTPANYYRKTIERGKLDYKCIEDLVIDRKKWRNTVRTREKR